MQIKKGIPVSPGIAIYPAVVLDAEEIPIPRRHVARTQTPIEQERVLEALQQAASDIETLRADAESTLGPEPARIFGFHLGMVQDQNLADQLTKRIHDERVTAQYAVYAVMRDLAQIFEQHPDQYFRERASDIWDIERRILRSLIGVVDTELGKVDHDAVVVAHDLTPSQAAGLDRRHIRGLATDAGGRTSHTAILAHALGIPAIVGLEDLSRDVSSGDTLIVDGHRGVVIINPDAAQLLAYRQAFDRFTAFESTLDELVDKPAVTTDGTRVELLANIEFPEEIETAIRKGAEGIGLYRTEFMFLAAEVEPSEEMQYEAYVGAIRALEGRPLTVRTLDLGADKLTRWAMHHDLRERNPFLGLRSIRLCLQSLPLFKRHLRAILRASVEGPVQIMFPLISHIMELRQAKMILNDVMEDLDEEGIPYRADIPTGMMVEVPSAALQATAFAREVDFFSIGTNDLIQYTVAVDRANERIASLYSSGHPAVVQLIRDVVRAAKRQDIDVSLCGEMGGAPEFVMLLVGLGLRKFSITPPAIPEVKKVIRTVSIHQCQRVARKALTFDSDREVLNYLRDELRKVAPEVYDGRSLED